MPENGTSFDELMQQRKYKEALELAEQQVPDAKQKVVDAKKPNDQKEALEAHINALIDQAIALDLLGSPEDIEKAETAMDEARKLQRKGIKSYEDDLEYKRAHGFNKYFTPREEVEYDWIYDYARSEYERLAQTSEYLDAKAGTLISYVSAFSGATAVAFAYQALTTDLLLGALVVPSFVLAILAVRHAMVARRPMDQPFPPALRVGIQCAHSHGRKAQAKFAAEFEVASEGVIAVTKLKAGHIAWATGLFIGSFGLLAFPLFRAIVRVLFNP